MYLREAIMSTTMVHVRVDEKTKQRAARTLAGMEVSVSDAVRMLLVRVAAEKALPFEVKVPNATTVKAMRAADKGKEKPLTSAGALFKESDPVRNPVEGTQFRRDMKLTRKRGKDVAKLREMILLLIGTHSDLF